MTDPSGSPNPAPGLGDRLRRPIQVIVVSSVMFTFISYWRTAAVVLGDLASTAYYIGGIVENAIGPAAPWFILAVMLFSYAVRSVYIESCSLFVRGGVYRVVKEAMGGFLAKLSVSALMFDYILTGPISAVSAGQYIMGLVLESLALLNPALRVDPDTADYIRRWGSVVIACAITLYFFRQNLLGIHESSGKALKIMIATTVVAVVLLAWCFITLAVRGPANRVPLAPDLPPKVEYETVMSKDPDTGLDRGSLEAAARTATLCPRWRPTRRAIPGPCRRINEATGRQEDPLGFIRDLWPGLAEQLRQPGNWLSLVGVIGLLLAFGHSILAMSGEETLAQVYREVESPKLPNFKKAAFIVFVYSLGLTATVSFLAVLLIPNDVRMKFYSDNLIGGLAMSVIGPPLARLVLERGGGDRRLPDPLRGGEHGHHRLQRRAEPRGRGRRDARLVPQAPPPLRHHLPRALPDRRPAVGRDPAEPRQHVRAGRGLRLRHRVELRASRRWPWSCSASRTAARGSSRCR